MTRRNPPAKWVLPEEVDPDTSICYVIRVPNEQFHIAAFLGALYNLTSARFWADDPDHTALLVAKVWQDIYDDLEHCIVEDWTVRLDPSDCTEVQQFDTASMDYVDRFNLRCAAETVLNEEFPPNNPPGQTQPGPQPGGSSPYPGQCFELKLRVGGFSATLIPLNVQTDWTITVESIDGATTDGFLAQFPPYISLWRCGDGNLYQLGSCFGSPELITSDPVPTSNHLIPLIQYPDATYQPLATGDTYTVPSQPDGFYQLLINNSPGAGTNPGVPAGELTVKLLLCSPGAVFTHTFAWDVDMQGWVTESAVYGYSQVAGQGLVTNMSAAAPGIVIKRTVSTPIVLVSYEYQYVCSTLGTLYTDDEMRVLPSNDLVYLNTFELGTITRSGLSDKTATTELTVGHIPGQSPMGQSTLKYLTITFHALYDPF